VTGTGNGSPQPHTVYGRVPAQATTPAPGTYTTTITVTVTY
ncbi:MAG TPA: spore coat protein U domain-containing protein, partial [Burkholderiaceae bacterium]